MLPTKFQVNWPFGSGEEAKKKKIDFQDGHCGGHLGFPIRTILASSFFYLQVTPMLPIKFQVNWPFGSGEEAKNRFSRSRIGTILAIFYLQVTPILTTKFRVKLPFGLGEEVRKTFQDGGRLGFSIGTILAIFDLQVIPMPQTKSKVNMFNGSGEVV